MCVRERERVCVCVCVCVCMCVCVCVCPQMKAGIVLKILAVPLLGLALDTWGNALFDFQNPPDFFFRNTTSAL